MASIYSLQIGLVLAGIIIYTTMVVNVCKETCSIAFRGCFIYCVYWLIYSPANRKVLSTRQFPSFDSNGTISL